MPSLKSLLLAATSAALALAAPTGEVDKRSETITASTTGTYGGYYLSNYVETGTDTLTLGTGSYSLSWTTANTDVVAGKQTEDYDLHMRQTNIGPDLLLQESAGRQVLPGKYAMRFFPVCD